MADDDDARPSLEAPQLFGRRRASRTPAPPPAQDPAADEPHFEDVGLDEPTTVIESQAETTAVLPVAGTTSPAAQPARPARRGSRLVRRALPAAGGGVDLDDGPLDEPATPPRTPRDRSQPLLPGRQAAVLVGVLAGLSLVGFTWVGFRGCEALRGTSSCGPGPGMAALVVVFVAAVTVGGYLLSYFRVPDPGATSFLAMGLTAVFCLVFLVDQLDHWSMVIVIPAVSAATYLLSWWVTTTYVDTD